MASSLTGLFSSSLADVALKARSLQASSLTGHLSMTKTVNLWQQLVHFSFLADMLSALELKYLAKLSNWKVDGREHVTGQTPHQIIVNPGSISKQTLPLHIIRARRLPHGLIRDHHSLWLVLLVVFVWFAAAVFLLRCFCFHTGPFTLQTAQP